MRVFPNVRVQVYGSIAAKGATFPRRYCFYEIGERLTIRFAEPQWKLQVGILTSPDKMVLWNWETQHLPVNDEAGTVPRALITSLAAEDNSSWKNRSSNHV
jgi:hypothetical protein